MVRNYTNSKEDREIQKDVPLRLSTCYISILQDKSFPSAITSNISSKSIFIGMIAELFQKNFSSVECLTTYSYDVIKAVFKSDDTKRSFVSSDKDIYGILQKIPVFLFLTSIICDYNGPKYLNKMWFKFEIYLW